MRSDRPSFGVIGAGFSGSLLAIHLLRNLPADGRVYLIDRREGFGRGQAYSTDHSGHLLNVPAGRMSAFPDEPEHFLHWLQGPADICGVTAGSFVPRSLFGRYIQYLLADQLRNEDGNRNLYLVPDEAVGLTVHQDGVTIGLASGRPTRVDAVVLAVGNFPPDAPRALRDLGRSPLYIADPWDDRVLARLPPSAPLLVIGSGLTMVDTVLALMNHGHTGPVVALSRRGLLPHRHAVSGGPVPWDQSEPIRPLSAVLHEIRRRTRQHEGDWRAVMDGLRPRLQALWVNLTEPERRQFLRHLRPWWDIHRHRMAPEVAARIDRILQTGHLTVMAGQVMGVEPRSDEIEVIYRPRASQDRQRLRVARIINCSGPATDYNRIEQPLIRKLLDDGLVRPDCLRLGLDVDRDLHLLDRDGQPNDRLYALGPVTKGRFWEVTAVAEIRQQALILADHLVRTGFPGAMSAVQSTL